MEQFLRKSASRLHGPQINLHESEPTTSSSTPLSPLVIAGIVSGCIVVGLLLWVLYRYMIWKPRMKARRAGGLPASPTMRSGGEASSNEASADEAKRLFAAIKAK